MAEHVYGVRSVTPCRNTTAAPRRSKQRPRTDIPISINKLCESSVGCVKMYQYIIKQLLQAETYFHTV